MIGFIIESGERIRGLAQMIGLVRVVGHGPTTVRSDTLGGIRESLIIIAIKRIARISLQIGMDCGMTSTVIRDSVLFARELDLTINAVRTEANVESLFFMYCMIGVNKLLLNKRDTF